MPDGIILYSAEDGVNLVQVFASVEKGNKVMISGRETNDPEEIVKVGEFFGMDPDMAHPNSINSVTSNAIRNDTCRCR